MDPIRKAFFALEKLTIGLTVVRNMAIGCGHKNRGTFSVAAAGLLRLGCGSMSFVYQLSPQTGGTLSCCLATWGSRSPGWLTFRRGAHYSKVNYGDINKHFQRLIF